MYQITNITDDPKQKLNVVLPDGVSIAQLSLRYLANLRSWYMDVLYEDISIKNRRICSSPNLLRQWNNVLPFGLACYTTDDSDPFFIDDFENGRCGLLVLTPDELDNYQQMLSELKNEA